MARSGELPGLLRRGAAGHRPGHAGDRCDLTAERDGLADARDERRSRLERLRRTVTAGQSGSRLQPAEVTVRPATAPGWGALLARRDLVVCLDDVVGVVARVDLAQAAVDLVVEHSARVPRTFAEIHEAASVPWCQRSLHLIEAL